MPLLDIRIQEWRRTLQQTHVFRSDDLDELESHLKDEIQTLLKAGLSEEEAFWIAEHRVGDGDKLVEEYRKVNASVIWKKRVLLMLGGYFFINVFLLMADIANAAYLLWIPWGTVQIPFLNLGANLRIAIIPGGLGILLFGIIYLGLTKRASHIGHGLRLFRVNRAWKAFSIVSFAVILSLTMFASWLWLAFYISKVSFQLLAQISVTNNLFALAFKFLMAVIFIGLATEFLLQKKERESQAE
jgi:hypothetical protein